MNREDILDSGRSAGDRAGGGSNMRSMPGSGGDMVDGGTSMERGRIRPMQGLGSATEADACTGFGAASARAGQGVSRNRENIDDARWGNGNRNNEEGFLMRNGSATTEAWTGLVNNDINFVWNHGRKFEGGFHCRYCNLRSRGGGATRFKEHLGHVIGEVKECPNVPRNIRDAMKGARNTQKKCTLSGFKKSMMSAVQDMGSHLGAGSAIFHRVMSKVSKRIDAMQKDTLMVAAAVLDPYTHYQINMSNIPEFAAALTDAIEKIADPDSAVLAIHEISTYRECRGRFGQRVARLSAGNMSPTEWWFQFGGEVPNLQKYALRIVSQCVSSSGCERNWSAFALVHTKQRNRLLYGKLHKCVSVRYNLRIRAEEDQDPVRENAKEKEVDPCAMMMDTTMFDESNPMLEWLNEDGEHTIFDGSEAASAVFEKIRSLNSSRKENHLGRKDNSRKRTRAMEEEEEDAYNDSEDDEEEENEYIDVDDDSDNEDGEDDSASEADGEVSGQAEKDGANQVRNVIEGTSDNLGNRRSGRVRQAKKVKDVNSLYY